MMAVEGRRVSNTRGGPARTRPGRSNRPRVPAGAAGRHKTDGAQVARDAARYSHYAAQQPARAAGVLKAAGALADPVPVDDFGGADVYDTLYAPQGNGGGGGRNRSGGGGGGGGGGGATAAAKKAYADMLAALDKAAKSDLASYDTRGKSLTDLQSQGVKRLDGIMSDLASSAGGARSGAVDAYAAADQRMGALAAELAANEAARSQGAANTLGAFGVSGGGVRQYGAQDTLGAQRGFLGGSRAATEAMYADRQAVHGGLQSDIAARDKAQYEQLQAQLAAQRQAAEKEAARQRAELALQAAQAGVKL